MTDNIVDLTKRREEKKKEAEAKEKAQRPSIFRRILGQVSETRQKKLEELKKEDAKKGDDFNPWLDA